ncbi:MAG TPA: hypothetical protein VKT29_08655, partial [Terriglobales bacterium]|nr:hypothetical protein [Terriglobales bacterium]
QAALRAWHKFVQGGDNIREIDVGVMQFAGASGSAAQQTIYFCCAAGIGVDAAVARRANRLPGWLRAHGGYFLVAIPALIAFRAQSIRVVATAQGGNSRVLSEPGILVAIANAPWYGHGMRIAPRAELNDAQLEVCFVRETGKLRLLRLFPKVYRGTHIGVPEVEYFRAEHVRIESEPPLAVHADGELAGYTPLEVSLLPRALRVIV